MNKVIFSNNNVQFIEANGHITNVAPSKVYTRINGDTVSFVFLPFAESSGLAFMTSLIKDLEIDGKVYNEDTILGALASKFAEASAVHIKVKVVDELPEKGDEDTIYLLPKEGDEENNSYEEYLYTDGKWEKIGTTDVNLSDYYTKDEVDSLIKQSDSPFEYGDNLDTAIQKGGDNKAYHHYTFASGYKTVASGDTSHAEGSGTTAQGEASHAEGRLTTALGYASHAEGNSTEANGHYSHAEGRKTKTTNHYEHASGYFNNTIGNGSSDFGEGNNTLFTVGNGNSEENRHNAIEIRQDGSIYYADTNASGGFYEKPMVKLQDKIKELEGNKGYEHRVEGTNLIIE